MGTFGVRQTLEMRLALLVDSMTDVAFRLEAFAVVDYEMDMIVLINITM